MKSCLNYLTLLGVVACATAAVAQDAPTPIPQQILELKNGDRITATIQSQTETNLVATTPFGNVTIPLEQIVKQTPVVPATEETKATESAPAKQAPAETKPAETKPAEAPAASEKVVEEKKEPQTFLGKFVSNLAGEVQVGLNAGYGASDYLNYYGRVHATHGFDRWKNIWDGKLTYGKNKGEVSANKLDTSYRLEFDAIPKKLFLYGEPTGGYDKIRSIDYFYTIGGGIGYHLLNKDTLTLDLSSGASYQSYHYAGEDARNDLYIDFGESFSWEIIKDLKITEKLTFSPQAKEWSTYRVSFEAGASWAFYKNMTFNFTVIDKYDSKPASDVKQNDLQLVTSLGLKF